MNIIQEIQNQCFDYMEIGMLRPDGIVMHPEDVQKASEHFKTFAAIEIEAENLVTIHGLKLYRSLDTKPGKFEFIHTPKQKLK